MYQYTIYIAIYIGPYSGPTWIIQDTLNHLKICNVVTSAKSLPYKITFTGCRD